MVTGGAGYIGSHMVKNLLVKGFNPIVVDNLVNGRKENVLTENFYQIDIGDKIALNSVFKKHKIDAVMHFAAHLFVGESVENPSMFYNNNFVATLNLLDCMLENNVKKFILSSTCATYGEPQYLPLDEKHPQSPINPYGRTKLMIENVLDDYDLAYGMKSACLRYFNAAGADESGDLPAEHPRERQILPLVLKVALGQSEYINVYGNDYETPDGTCIRDYVHVNDITAAHILALEKLYNDNESIKVNLGTGKGTSVKEIIKAAERVTGKEIPVLYTDRRPGDPARLVASNKMAQEVLYWLPKYVDVDEIVASAYNVMKR